MDARALTEQQRYRLGVAAADRRDWYKRVRERMDAVGWDKACPAYLATLAAYDAAQALSSALNDSRPPVPPPIGVRPMERVEPICPPMPDMPWVGKRGASRGRSR